MIKKISLSILLSTLVFSQEVTLDDLVTKALNNSPDIKISQASYKASSQKTLQADADYLPQVNLNAEAGKQSVDYKDQKVDVGAGQTPLEFGRQETDLLLGSVTAKQLIYDFGKTTGNIEKFEYQEKASKSSMQQTISNKIFSVKKSYYALLSQHALVKVNQEDVKLNEQQLYRSQRYFEAGIRTKVDITDAKVNLIKAQLSLQDTKYNIKLASVDLNKELGINSDKVSYDIYIPNLDLKNVYESLTKLTKDEKYYREEAYNNRAELQEYRYLVDSYKAQYKRINGDYYPGLYANGEYMLQDVDEDAFAPEEQWKATVSVEWNLFSGNKTKAQEEEARINILKSQAQLDDTLLKIQKEVSDAYISVNKELDNIKLSQSLTEASKEKYIQAEKRYENGLADFVELQEARQTYIDSLADLTQRYYRYYTALAQLDNAIGK